MSAPSAWSRPGRPRDRRYRPWPFAPRPRFGAADQAALECGAGGRGQHRHLRRRQGPDRCRRRLHPRSVSGPARSAPPGSSPGGRAAAHRHHGSRRGGAADRHAGHRRRRHQVFRRPRQGDRGRGRLRHGGLAARRHRRNAGRGVSLSGPLLQGLSRHGLVAAMARGSADRYFQQDIKDNLKLVPEGVEGQVPYKGRWRTSCTSSQAACAPPWAMSAPTTSPSCIKRRSSCAFPMPACAKAMSTTSPSPGKARTIRAGSRCGFPPRLRGGWPSASEVGWGTAVRSVEGSKNPTLALPEKRGGKKRDQS